MSKLPDQYGQKSKPTKDTPNTKGNPVKHTDGKANLGAKCVVKHAGK